MSSNIFDDVIVMNINSAIVCWYHLDGRLFGNRVNFLFLLSSEEWLGIDNSLESTSLATNALEQLMLP